MKPKKLGLSFDDEEILSIILDNEHFQVLSKLLERFQSQFERSLIQYNLSEGAEKLLLEKARIEGSARMIAELKKFREMRAKERKTAVPQKP